MTTLTYAFEVIRNERTNGGRRVVVLVNGEAVAFRSGRGRHWSCQACHIPGDGDCQHIRMVRGLLS